MPYTKHYANTTLGGGADTTAPVISGVSIYNNREDTYSSIGSNSAATVTATITDAGQASITTVMITANLTDLGGESAVNPGSYDTSTGIATWTLADTTPTEGIGVVVTISAEDASGNIGTPATGTTIADNTAPVFSAATIYNQSFDNYNTIANGSTAVVTLAVTDTNSNLITATDVTMDLAVLGGAASVSADSYNSTTGIATWTVASVTLSPADGTLFVTGGVRDDAGNISSPGNSSVITADNTAPVLSAASYWDGTLGVYNTIGQGDVLTVTCTITETNMGFMTVTNTSADVSQFGGGASANADSIDSLNGLLTWTVASTVVGQYGNNSANIQVIDQAGNFSAPLATLVTPDFVGEGLVLLIAMANPVSTQGITNAGFVDWSPSKYDMINTGSDAAFYTSPNSFVVTFDGTTDYISGDTITAGDPMAVTTQFTVMTILRYDGTSASRDIASKFTTSAGASEWTIPSQFSAGAAAFNRSGIAGISNGVAVDFAIESNVQTITTNVSNAGVLSVWALEYDFTNSTVNIIGDYDVTTLANDGNCTTFNMTVSVGSINNALVFDGCPLQIGGEQFGLKTFVGAMGPFLIYNRILGQDEIDQNRRKLETMTGYTNGGP